jgi:hypothetical protein
MTWKVIGFIAAGLLLVQACGTIAPTAPTPTISMPSDGMPLSYRNISYVIPDGLASGANPELVPAVGEGAGAPWEVAPEYLKITLVGYPLQGMFFEPHILVYPAAELEAVNPAAAQSLEQLRTSLDGSAVPLNEDIPGVPMFHAAKVFGSHIAKVNTQNGMGVRMLTSYTQDLSPITNQELIYQFQGFTNDGKYYIIATLPVNASFLATDEEPGSPLPADGIPFPDLNTADETQINDYAQAVADKLNSMDAISFTPSLNQLDTLIQSILVTP